MRKLSSISMIAMAAVLLATAGCVGTQSDVVGDEKDLALKSAVAEVVRVTVELPPEGRVEAEAVVDAEMDLVAPDLEEFDTSRIDPVPYSDGVEVEPSGVFNTEAVEGENYEQLFVATGGSGVFGDGQWSCTIDSSPCAGYGLDIVPYGTYQATLEGTPSVSGVLHVTITAADFHPPNLSGSYAFDLTVAAAEVDPDPDPDPADGEGDCSQPLKISWDASGTNKPDVEEVTHTLSRERSVKLTVTGGRPPYTWTVNSRVKDSHHKFNAGGKGNNSVHRMKGITNYKYWDPDKECMTPEEYEDIYGMDDEDAFWPNCSNPNNLPGDKKQLCNKIGCGHSDWWHGDLQQMEHHGEPIEVGSELWRHALHCKHGFGECPPLGEWHTLPDYHRTACEEYLTWKHPGQNGLIDVPRYICKYTTDPTWRKRGVEIPNVSHDQYGRPDEEVWDWWNPPKRYGEWKPKKAYKTGDNTITLAGNENTITFVSDTEFDGPLPVNREGYRQRNSNVWGERPVERLTFTVTDSCGVLSSGDGAIVVPRIGFASLDASLKYPNTPITDFKVTVKYSDYKREGSFPENRYLLDFLFVDEDNYLEEGMNWQDALEEFGVSAHFGIADWRKCRNDICTEKADVFNDEEDDAPNVKDIDSIHMRVYAGHQAVTGALGVDPTVRWGDLDIKYVYIKDRYWRAGYDDSEAGNQFNNNVNGWMPDCTNLTNLDGWADMNGKGESFRFHRRDVIPGRFTF